MPTLIFLLISAIASGQSLEFSTYLGGSGNDWIRDVATDTQGNVYVTGGTQSANFPTTAGAHDRTFNGNCDVFIAKFSPSGALIWSTYLGGPNYDRAYAIEVDASGVYVGGRAGAGYPTTPNAPQNQFAGDTNPNSGYGTQDGFISKISLDGKQLLWSTYVGDTGRGFFRDIALDGQGSVYGALTAVDGNLALVAAGVYDATHNGGEDGAVVKLGTSGAFYWATYFGAGGNDVGTPSIRADATGAYVLGTTNSANMPTTAGLDRTYAGGTDMHLAKFSPDGSTLLWGTYFGGSMVEFSETHGLALDASGNLYIGITTKSAGLATSLAYDATYNGSGSNNCGNYCGDGLVAHFSNSGVLQSATYFGGSVGDGIEGIGVDAAGNVYVAGSTYSLIPIVDGHQATNKGMGDFFVAKLSGNLSTLLYSSYLGGTSVDFARSLHVDPQGNFYVSGHSNGVFPVLNPLQGRGGAHDGVIAKFGAN